MEFLSPDQHNEKGYCFQCSLVQCSQTAPQDVWIRGPSFHLSRIKWIQLTSGSSEDDRQYSKFCRGNKNNDPSVFHSAIYVNENDQTQYTIEFLSTINASSFHIVPWLLVATSAFREHLNIKNVYPKSPIRSWYHQLVGRKQLLRSYHASFLWQTPLIIASKPFYTPMSYTERLQDALAFCWFFVDLMFFLVGQVHVFVAYIPTSRVLLAILSPAENRPRGTPLFVSTLLLKNLGGRPGERMAFCGEQKPNKQDNLWVVGERLIGFWWPLLRMHTYNYRQKNTVTDSKRCRTQKPYNVVGWWKLMLILGRECVSYCGQNLGFMFLHEEAFFGQIGFGGFDIPVASIVDPHYPFLLILNPPFP